MRWVFLGLGLLLIACILGVNSYVNHRDIDATERDRLTHQVNVVTANLSERLQTINNTLDTIRNELPGLQREGDTNQHLHAMVVAQIAIRSLVVMDANGDSIASNRPELVGRNFRDSARFQTISQGDPDLLYISEPFVTVLGNFAIGVGKAITTEQGKFNGYVLAIIDANYFSNLLGSVRYAPDVNTWLLHGDGKVVFRVPTDRQVLGQDASKDPNSLYSRVIRLGTPQGILSTTSRSSGQLRMTAFGFIQPGQTKVDKPLIVTVSRDVSVMFARWTKDLVFEVGVFAAFVVLAVFGMFMYQRRRDAYDRLEVASDTERIQADQQLRDSEKRFRNLFEQLPVAYQSLDAAGCWLDANQQMADLLGFDSPAEMMGQDFSTFWEEPYRSNFAGALTTFKTAQRVTDEITIRRRNGELLNVILTGRVQTDAQGQFVCTHCILVNVSEKRALEHRIHQLHQVQDLYDNAPCGYHSLDRNGHIVLINQTELNWLGLTRDEALGRPFTDFLTDAGKAVFQARFPEFLKTGSVHDLEFDLLRKDGTTIAVLVGATAIKDDAGQLVMSRSTVFDITERKRLERQLERLARTDALTGLSNRRDFYEFAEKEISRSRRSHSPLSILMLDIDFFKQVNDRYGHPVGDDVLKHLTHICKTILRGVDLLARMGGEEFAVLMPDTTLAHALEVAERLRQGIAAAPLVLSDGLEIAITASIGATQLLDADLSVEPLLHRVDSALYQAKRDGRNCVRWSSPQMTQ